MLNCYSSTSKLKVETLKTHNSAGSRMFGESLEFFQLRNVCITSGRYLIFIFCTQLFITFNVLACRNLVVYGFPPGKKPYLRWKWPVDQEDEI